MKNCFKKIFLLLIAVCCAFTITSCKKDKNKTVYYEVKYLVENAEYAQYKIEKGKTAPEIVAPTVEGKIFEYWTWNGYKYDFKTPITASVTFVAQYKVDETGIPSVVKTALEKVVAGAEFSKVEIEATDNLKAEYNAVKDGKTTVIYYLEKANTFTTVKMYVGILDGKVVNMVTTQSDTIGMSSKFNGTDMKINGTTVDTFGDSFKSVSGATISSNTVKDLMAIAFAKYAEREGGEETSNFQFNSKTQTIVDMINPTGNIVIPEEIRGVKVLALGENLFKENEDITGVEIPASVTRIGFSAFEGCTNLTNVKFAETASDETLTIEIKAFAGCTSLTKIALPKNVDTIASGMFEGCTELKTVESGNNIKVIGTEAFKDCTKLENANFGAVEQISANAYENCTALSNVTLPATLKTIGEEAFKNCTAIATLNIPASTTSISLKAFAGCAKLTAINVDSENTKYTSVNGALYNKAATSLLMVPNKELTTFELPATVTSIETDAFANLVNLQTITVAEDSTKYEAVNGVLYSVTPASGSKARTTKLEMVPAKFNGEVKLLADTNNIASNVFAHCPNISKVTIEEGNEFFVEIDHIIYRRASSTSTYYTLVLANRDFTGVATILKDTTGTLSSIDVSAFVNATITGIRFTSEKQIVNVQTNIFASVPTGFKVYVPAGMTNKFVGMTNNKWSANFKEVVSAMIVEDTAE